MATDNPLTPRRPPTVFLSYASEDRVAARLIRDALQGFGLEVWYDESELDGGDAWDQKIRRQIRECDLFMPVVSAQTEARHEGYFRREWRIGVERTLDMADDHIFLLPVVIDSTEATTARVPDKFQTVQWTKLPGGQSTAAFEALCKRLVSGSTVQEKEPAPARQIVVDTSSKRRRRGKVEEGPAPAYREFPKMADAADKGHYYANVGMWGIHSLWASFKRLPRWVRFFLYFWLVIVATSWMGKIGGYSGGSHSSPRPPRSERLSTEEMQKLKDISDSYQGGSGNQIDVDKLVASVTRNLPRAAGAAGAAGAKAELAAIPFTAPADDAAAKKVAGATFAQAYGRVSISHPGQVALISDPLPSGNAEAAAALARGRSASYVLIGTVDGTAASQSLNVKWVAAEDGSVAWSASFPVAGADPEKIAVEVDKQTPDLDND
jgi:TIR domain-containing protein